MATASKNPNEKKQAPKKLQLWHSYHSILCCTKKFSFPKCLFYINMTSLFINEKEAYQKCLSKSVRLNKSARVP